MEKTIIYIARHGQTLWNAKRLFQGQRDIDLSPLGIKQAKKLGERLKTVEFDAVYTSDLKRTIDTAHYAMGGRAYQSTQIKGLGEMNFGIWEGKNIDDLIKEEPDLMDTFYYNPGLFVLEGAETIHDFIARVVENFESIAKKHFGETIFIVAHGGVINALKYNYQHHDLTDFWTSKPYVAPTAISVLTYEDGQIKFTQMPDASHCDGLE